LFINITLETTPNEMQCNETISHMVTAGRSYFRTQRNVCVAAGKTTMAAGKINYGCFEMLSWPHRTSNHIINICFWLLETCMKCSYFNRGKHVTRGSMVGIWSEVCVYRAPNYEYIVGRRSTVGQVTDNLRL